jgi:hypothetical protein
VAGGDLAGGKPLQIVEMSGPIILDVMVVVKAEAGARPLERGTAGGQIEQDAVAPGLVGFPIVEELFGYDETRTVTVVRQALDAGAVEYI